MADSTITDEKPIEDEPLRNAERILFFPEPCTRLAGEECTRCQLVCPAHAISFSSNGTPQVDETACTLCGICIGICDSFGSSLITTYDHAKRMVRKAQDDGRIYLCCSEDAFEGLAPAENVFVLHCLSALSPEFLTYLLSTGKDVVLCHDLRYCEQCEMGGAFGGKLWERAVELAQSWTGRSISSTDTIPEKKDLAQKMAADTDRRALFTGAIGAAAEVASGKYREKKSTAVDDFIARRERMRAQLQSSTRKTAYLDDDSRAQSVQSRFTRKILLNEARQNDPSIAERMGSTAE